MKKLIALFTVLLIAAASNAMILTDFDSVTNKSLGWDGILYVNQFDPMAGTLQQVTVTVFSRSHGNGKYENMSTKSGGYWGYSLDADTTISQASSPLLSLLIDYSEQLPDTGIFDGAIDFAGTSGATGIGFDESISHIYVYTGSNMNLFIGTGLVGYDVLSNALSSQSGSGNIVTLIQSHLDASVNIEYQYIPEPATICLLALGSLAFIGRKK